MTDSDLPETFVTKIDAFASSLEPDEQTMLIELLTAGDDVAGFGGFGPSGDLGSTWPGLMKLGIGHVASTAGAGADNLLSHEMTHVTQQRSGDMSG